MFDGVLKKCSAYWGIFSLSNYTVIALSAHHVRHRNSTWKQFRTQVFSAGGDMLNGKKLYFPLLFFFWTKQNYWIFKKNKFKDTAGECRYVTAWKSVVCCREEMQVESSHAEDTLQKSSSLWSIEKMEVHRHLCLVSLGSLIKAFLPSVLSTEITPDVGLLLTGSEDPDETYSWLLCWTA